MDRTSAILDKLMLQIEQYQSDDLTRSKLRAAALLSGMFHGWEMAYIKGDAPLQNVSAMYFNNTLDEVFNFSYPQTINLMRYQNSAEVENLLELPYQALMDFTDAFIRNESSQMSMMFALNVIRLDLYAYLDDYADSTTRDDIERIKQTGRDILGFYGELGLTLVYAYSPLISPELVIKFEEFADILRENRLKGYSYEQVVKLQTDLEVWYDELFESLLASSSAT